MFSKICAWLSLLFVIAATLGPIGTRPVSGLPTLLERIGAFALVGSLFAFAYPRNLPILGVLLALVIVLLEAVQLFSPGRHARLVDVVEKISGAVAGVVFVSLGRQYFFGGGR